MSLFLLLYESFSVLFIVLKDRTWDFHVRFAGEKKYAAAVHHSNLAAIHAGYVDRVPTLLYLPSPCPHNSHPVSGRAAVEGFRAKALHRRAPRRSRVEENKPTHLSLLHDDCLVAQHLQV